MKTGMMFMRKSNTGVRKNNQGRKNISTGADRQGTQTMDSMVGRVIKGPDLGSG